MDYLKIAYVSLNKTALLIRCYFLLALSITPSLLMKTALIRGNCLALSASCCIVILHRYIPPALLWRIWRIISLTSLPTKSPTIRHELESNPKQGFHFFEEASVATTKLHRFSCPPPSTLLKILRPLASKSCELDPVPSSILLGCLDLLCPVISKIMNCL